MPFHGGIDHIRNTQIIRGVRMFWFNISLAVIVGLIVIFAGYGYIVTRLEDRLNLKSHDRDAT